MLPSGFALAQHDAEAGCGRPIFRASSSPFRWPARFAAGLGYRRNTYSTRVDQILKNADVGVLHQRQRRIDQCEGTLCRASLPAAGRQTLVHKLEVDAGYRYSYYNLSGGAHTWKANLILPK
jgi:hypothetical protein